MAYVVRTSQYLSTTTSAESLPLPSHLEDDLIVIWSCTLNNTGMATPTGWTKVTTVDCGSGRTYLFYRFATGGTLSNPSVTPIVTGVSWQFAVIRGASSVGDSDSTDVNNNGSCGPLTLTQDPQLVMVFCGGERLQENPFFGAGEVMELAYFIGSNNGPSGIGYTYSDNAEAKTFSISGNAGYGADPNDMVVAALAIVDDGSGLTRPYQKTNSSDLLLRGIRDVEGKTKTLTDPTSGSPSITSLTNDTSGNSFTTAGGTLFYQAPQTGTLAGFLHLETGKRSSPYYNTGTGDTDKVCLVSWVYSPSINLSSKLVSIAFKLDKNGLNSRDDLGVVVGFGDGTNVSFFLIGAGDITERAGYYTAVINTADSATYEIGTVGAGSLSWSAVTTIYVGFNVFTIDIDPIYPNISIADTITILGGSATTPASFTDVSVAAQAGIVNTVSKQGRNQFLISQNISIGDGSGAIVWNSANQSIEFPKAYDYQNGDVRVQTSQGSLSLTVDAAATFSASANVWSMGDFHQVVFESGTCSSSVTVPTATLVFNGGTISNFIFSGCKGYSGTIGTTLTGGNTFTDLADGETEYFSVASETEFNKLQNQIFRNASGAGMAAVEITGDQTGAWTTDPNWTVSGNTVDIRYTGATNFSIASAGALTVTNTGAGTLTIVTPVNTLSINTDVTALIRYFTDDSQTVVDSDTNTTLDYVYSTTDPIDIEAVVQNYVPFNRQNFTPINGDFDIELDFDEAYNASHGLTITGEYDLTRTGVSVQSLTINSDQNAFDIRSAVADLIRTNSSYYNTKLLLEAIPGLARIDQLGGLTVTGMDKWKRAGSEVFDAADATNPVKKYFAIQSVGTITGATTHYRQSDSGDSTAITLTNNVVDEAFLYYEDADHDGTPSSDLSGYMLIKSFLAGSKQGRVDVLANAGISALKSTLYVVPLSNAAHDYAGTDPGISADLTLVTGGTVGGKSFSYKIVDGGTNSGADIADQLNYNAANNPNSVIPGGTGLRYFELPDMVIHNATAVETERGFKEGTTPALVGFYVERGGVDHPDFTRFQADDGTYYTPAVTANWTGTNLPDDAGANTLLQISNLSAVNGTLWGTGQTITAGNIRLRSTGTGSESTAGLYYRAENSGTTHATTEPTWPTTAGLTVNDNGIVWRCYKILFYDQDPASTGASGSYIDGEEFAAGEQAAIAFYHQNADVSFESGSTVAAVAASGFSFDAANFVTADPVYASNAIDGSTRTEFTADYAVSGTVEVDVSSDIDSSPENAYAWYCYSLTTSAGAWLFAGAITAIDEGNYRNNTAVASVKFDNTTTGSVSLQGTGSRFFRDDGANPEKIPTTSGFGVSISWELPVYLKTQTLSGSNVITGDIADLNDPSVAEIVAGIEGGTMAGRVTSILADTADMQPRVVSIESVTDLLTLAGITSAVWSAQPSSYTTNNTMGKVIKGIQEGWLSAEGEVNDGAPSTTQFATTLPSAVDDFYAGNPLTFTNGSLAGQSRVITAYNGTTKQVTLDHALTGAPANGDSFNVLADHIHTIDEIQSGLATSAELVDPAARIAELWRLLGLDADEPMIISSTSHAGTSVSVTITDNGNGSVTLQRV